MNRGYEWLYSQNYIEQYKTGIELPHSGTRSVEVAYFRRWCMGNGPYGELINLDRMPEGRSVWRRRAELFRLIGFHNDRI